MTLRSPRSRLNFTVHQPDNSTIPVQAFKQGDLVHIPVHRFRIGLVKGDALDRIYLVCIVHHAVNARRAALANQIEPRVRLLAHNEVACPYLHDGYMRHVFLACSGRHIRRGAAPLPSGSDWGAWGRRGLGQLG